MSDRRADARAIWDAAVTAAEPRRLGREALTGPLAGAIGETARVLVVGGGKAAAAMAAGLEDALVQMLDHIEGLVNVPAASELSLESVNLHAARPAGTNYPTADGVVGAELMLKLMTDAQPD